VTTEPGLLAALGQGLAALERTARLGVAVSGGGDSLALLHLLALRDNSTLCVATVDHGLRAEAAEEAAGVARTCAGLGVSHECLTWRGWTGEGNLQDQARRARYRLLADWGRRQGLDAIALGHTADDQAETFLMRLARESGLDGLSAMPGVFRRGDMLFCRPLLAVRRSQLRGFLRRRGVSWVDDPSNDDDRFDRVRARAALATLEPLGLTVPAIAGVASNLRLARKALDRATVQAAAECSAQQAGSVAFDLVGFSRLDAEIRRRLLNGALRWVAGTDYAPRARALAAAQKRLARGESTTLHGCVLLATGQKLWVVRELQAVATMRGATDRMWDGRWAVTGPHAADLHVAALTGAGLARCPGWREIGLPRAALLSSPAIWRGQNLVSAPIVGVSNGWYAELAQSRADFTESLQSH